MRDESPRDLPGDSQAGFSWIWTLFPPPPETGWKFPKSGFYSRPTLLAVFHGAVLRQQPIQNLGKAGKQSRFTPGYPGKPSIPKAALPSLGSLRIPKQLRPGSSRTLLDQARSQRGGENRAREKSQREAGIRFIPCTMGNHKPPGINGDSGINGGSGRCRFPRPHPGISPHYGTGRGVIKSQLMTKRREKRLPRMESWREGIRELGPESDPLLLPPIAAAAGCSGSGFSGSWKD